MLTEIILCFCVEDLQRYFGRFGEVIDCVVMKNSESGRSRGFGFVTFADPANVDVVLRSGPHVLDSRTVRIRNVELVVGNEKLFLSPVCISVTNSFDWEVRSS